jgi:hypothetical protein
VAELVDARDLKFVAPFEIHRIFCITRPETKTKIDAKRRDLHNARIAALAALALITAPAFGQAVAPRCDTWCTACVARARTFATTVPGSARASIRLWYQGSIRANRLAEKLRLSGWPVVMSSATAPEFRTTTNRRIAHAMRASLVVSHHRVERGQSLWLWR